MILKNIIIYNYNLKYDEVKTQNCDTVIKLHCFQKTKRKPAYFFSPKKQK